MTREFITEYGNQIRIILFCLSLLAFHFFEIIFPKRENRIHKTNRWICNLGLIVIANIFIKISIPLLPFSFAIAIEDKGIGVFSTLEVPYFIVIVMSIIFLDLTIYYQHRLFHSLPWLWRIHQVHHSDIDLDVSSGNRFHPLEIFISILVKLAIIAILGIPPLAIFCFEILLNTMSQFNHSNLHIPDKIENFCRRIIVTPDYHRVHHSIHIEESNRNFGFNLSLWDRLFNTYKPHPKNGHHSGKLGIGELRDSKKLSLKFLLLMPFTK